MKLDYSIEQCSSFFGGELIGSREQRITHVLYDTRKITHPEGGLFFALEGTSRSGSEFIQQAYELGVRAFVVSKNQTFAKHEDAVYFVVVDTLMALQQLAAHHRSKFSYPVVAITGSMGKTTLKEWLFHSISDRFKVVRSPKSFNSQLGVALSLLELHENASIALIEAGISKPGEMEKLRQMIQPNFGLFTGLGNAHREHFSSKEEHLLEKWSLFTDCRLVFVPASFAELEHRLPGNFQVCGEIVNSRFPTGYAGMLGVLSSFLSYLQYTKEEITNKLNSLPNLALRMEVFEGINGNTIINDTYNLDLDALREALLFQKQVAGEQKRVVLIGLADKFQPDQASIEELIREFAPAEYAFIPEGESIHWENYHHANILVKAHRDRAFEHEVAKGKALKHRTVVEINLSAIKHNVEFYRERLPKNVAILAMVKAASYGAGAEQVASFLQKQGIQHFGVAFADEGVSLRKSGINQEIVVMNPDPEHSDLIIDYQLAPAIYSFEQLDEFITTLIHRKIQGYPVHLKFDTGMHRLGFNPSDKEKLAGIIQAQPEVRIAGIYSHLADADNFQSDVFTKKQLDSFEQVISYFRGIFTYEFNAHILNSEGALRFPAHAYDMVRLGISMYGYTENKELQPYFQPSISWFSAISQIKRVPKGECIGYGCSFEAPSDLDVAVVPVGYADGFRRNLSNGVGSVIIRNQKCLVLGRVCMDMIMVDVTGLSAKMNDRVEIIGPNQSMQDFARMLGTIPYEVMTGMSKRMHRVYVEE